MYSSTYYKLKKQSTNIALQNSIESRAEEIRILKEKRFLKTIVTIACIAFVCSVPSMLMFFIYYCECVMVQRITRKKAVYFLSCDRSF